MNPRQYAHLLLLLSYATIFSCCLILIIKYDRTGWLQKIWIGSKILTVKYEIKQNNYELYPILSFNSDGTKNNYHQNYASLLQHSGTKCGGYYQKCGILDTYGNLMCIPRGEECPINNVVVDSSFKKNQYLSNNYRYVHLENLTKDYLLYYTNKETNKEIISKIVFNDEIPKFINKDNLIFDSSTYSSYLKSINSGRNGDDRDDDFDGYDGYDGYDDDRDWGDWGGIGDGDGGFRNLDEEYGDNKVDRYIRDKFNENINIDKSFKKIYDNLYVGNYIGFKNYTSMNNFNNIDLYKSYFTIFPNLTSNIFCYICLVALFFLSIFSLCRFCHKDTPNEGSNYCCVCCVKIFIIIIYLTIFIGFFLYFIFEYINIYKKRNPENLINIRAHDFLENLLDEIYNRNLHKNFILSFIILFPFSFLIYIIGWILSTIFTIRFREFKINAN